jgi:exonuclease III
MKILSWNCRGLARPAMVLTLRRLIRDQSPDLLFLSETKISPSQVSATLNKLGFFLMSQVPASGLSGGLVLSWRPGVDLECFSLNKHSISAWCYSDPPQTPWIISCVYAPPKRSDRLKFWDSFSEIGKGFEASWLCIGDFNFVLDQTEKKGGRPVANSSNLPSENS